MVGRLVMEGGTNALKYLYSGHMYSLRYLTAVHSYVPRVRLKF